MIRTLLGLGLAGAMLAQPAAAQKPAAPKPAVQKPEALEGNLRCVSALFVITPTLPEEQRPQVVTGIMYFMGVVDGQAPGTNLETELRRLIPAMTRDMVNSEAQRCGGILIGKGTQLEALGKALVEGTSPKP